MRHEVRKARLPEPPNELAPHQRVWAAVDVRQSRLQVKVGQIPYDRRAIQFAGNHSPARPQHTYDLTDR